MSADTFMKGVIGNLYTGLQVDNVKKLETVQSLWSGYGEIARYSVVIADISGSSEGMVKHSLSSSDEPERRVIISKCVNTQAVSAHPRGWSGDVSHQRKIASYHNEQSFYRSLSPFTNQQCRVPEYLAGGQDEHHIYMLLEDLNQSGYVLRFDELPLHHEPAYSLQVVENTIAWLANFHAAMLIPNIESPSVTDSFSYSVSQIAPIGTYWHLDTRPDEFLQMPTSALKTAAKEIDSQLNAASYQTVVHGDAKLANFCYNTDKSNDIQVSAVDFQYAGKGAGIKDIVYFLGSCFDSQQLDAYAKDMVDYYFTTLKSVLTVDEDEKQQIEAQWRYLEAFAWADFERFLQGWLPSHRKLTDYSERMTQAVLNRLTRE